MGVRVELSVSGSGNVAWYEVSGGTEGNLNSGKYALSFGQEGGTISFLTVKRIGSGTVSVKSLEGTLSVEVDNNSKSPKTVKKGSSFKMASKSTRLFVKEKVKE